MINIETIAKSEQKDFIATFWMMLRECETRADNENDPILKHWVEGWYLQWNRVTGTELSPAWIERAKGTQ